MSISSLSSLTDELEAVSQYPCPLCSVWARCDSCRGRMRRLTREIREKAEDILYGPIPGHSTGGE